MHHHYTGEHSVANQTSQRQRRKALVLALAMFVAGGASAQTNTAGAVAGRAASGDTITITNPATGLSRTVSVGADGSYRFAQLPTGEYQIMRNGGQARTVNVSIGGTAGIDFVSRDGATTLDTVTVVGSGAINPIDVSSVESSTILTKEVIDQLPVDRNYTAVALLAPGTVKGDQGFGNLASFGGASVGENAYYINGFNVTNFRNGLGGATVPFDFYQEFQVKTGGYGAEFGRSTGGVINTVTKRGSNEWTIGARLAWAPDAGAEDFPSSILPDGRVRVLNQFDYGTET
ncbi:MAG: Oar protein, partial [Thermomonas sp.]